MLMHNTALDKFLIGSADIYLLEASTKFATGLEKNLFGNHPVSLPIPESRHPPPAFASDPLVHVSTTTGRGEKNTADSLDSIKDHDGSYPPATGIESSKHSATDIMGINGAGHGPNFVKTGSPAAPGATTRKAPFPVDRQNSEISYYADDEDGNQKKYSRRVEDRLKDSSFNDPTYTNKSLDNSPFGQPSLSFQNTPQGKASYTTLPWDITFEPSNLGPFKTRIVVFNVVIAALNCVLSRWSKSPHSFVLAISIKGHMLKLVPISGKELMELIGGGHLLS
ncbi:hypothetical protein GIB67_028281 [Kingdonia uniflora]|uniref:Uncharacterized protein n=1 Tax=Kingdonia uniflora TaxID=39325 RepID=A0A7J7KZA2_9MAGN|nr:hypothetical protein GIB67_028281 [Kingdonia uniflora]